MNESKKKAWASFDDAIGELARSRGEPSATWTYTNALGEPVGVVIRWDGTDGKDILPLRHDPDGWRLKAMESPRTLYRLPTLLESPASETVYICEGEKAADAAVSAGLIATTSIGGSKAANKSDWSPLAGRDVVILPDNDEPGEAYAGDVVKRAQAAGARSVRVVRLCGAWPAMPKGGDLADLLNVEGPWAGWEDEDILGAIEKLVAVAESIDADDEGVDDPELFPEAEAFPLALAATRDYFSAVAEMIQVPLEAVALLGMAIATTGALKKVEVDCYLNGKSEPAPLWALVLLPSGERKSALLAELTAIITEWQRDEAKRLAPKISRQREAELIAEKHRCSLRKRAARDGDSSEALLLSEEIADEKPIVAPCLKITEATPEALAVSMVENGERALIAAAEGDAIDIVLGRYSNHTNLGIYLAGHSGDPVNSLRIGRRRVSMKRPAIAMALIVQPDAMLEAYESRAARGRGFLARFLGCAPVSKLGRRKIRPQPVPDQLRAAAWTAPMRAMLDWLLPDEDEKPTIARFDAKGQRLFDAFREEIEPRLDLQTGDLGATDSVRAWASKLPGALARLALAMECFASTLDERTDPPTTIHEATVRAALAWAPWLIDASRRAEAVALARDNDDDDKLPGLTPGQRELVKWIGGKGGSVSIRELTQGPRRFRGDSEGAKTALDELADAGIAHWKYEGKTERLILGSEGGYSGAGYTSPILDPVKATSVAVAGVAVVKNNGIAA